MPSAIGRDVSLQRGWSTTLPQSTKVANATIIATYKDCVTSVTTVNQAERRTKEMRGIKVTLNDTQEAYLIKHYKHTKNAELAAKFGVGERSVVRIARKLGLTKTAQFMRKCQIEARQAAREYHQSHGSYPPKGFVIPNREAGQFRKGETSLERLGRKKESERIRKAAESRAKTWKSERARATFGLPQRTKLRVIPQPKAKVELRYYLKKRGYIVDDAARVVYYDENTRRGKRIEEKPQRWYKFLPIEQRVVC